MASPQQKWNDEHPEKMREYDRERRANYRQVTIRLHLEHDRKLIEYLESHDLAFSRYFKDAGKEKIEKSLA